MKELKSIIWVLVLVVGGFVLYKVLPVYWSNFKVDRMIAQQAIYYTNYPKSDEEIKIVVAQKAQDYDVALAPDQVTVVRTRGDLSISLAYAVHIDLPGYPFDLKFNNSTSNHNIMVP